MNNQYAATVAAIDRRCGSGPLSIRARLRMVVFLHCRAQKVEIRRAVHLRFLLSKPGIPFVSSVLLSPWLVLANATIWLDRLRPRLTTDPRRAPRNLVHFALPRVRSGDRARACHYRQPEQRYSEVNRQTPFHARRVDRHGHQMARLAAGPEARSAMMPRSHASMLNQEGCRDQRICHSLTSRTRYRNTWLGQLYRDRAGRPNRRDVGTICDGSQRTNELSILRSGWIFPGRNIPASAYLSKCDVLHLNWVRVWHCREHEHCRRR
jgi:hypothetical protein